MRSVWFGSGGIVEGGSDTPLLVKLVELIVFFKTSFD